MYHAKRIKIALFLVLGLAFSLHLSAQRGNRLSAEEREARMEEVIEKLELDQAQAASFRDIYSKYAKKTDALWSSNIPREDMRAAMMTLRSESREELEALLSEEQMKTLDELQREQARSRRGPRNDNRQNDRKSKRPGS